MIGSATRGTLAPRWSAQWQGVRRPTPIEVGLIFAAALMAGRYAICFLNGESTVGCDLAIFRDTFARTISGGPMYPAVQTAGPFVANFDGGGVIFGAPVSLYPPITTAFLAATLLPAPAWWLIPLAVTAAMLAWACPAPWAWVLILACLFPASSVMLVVAGNFTMWLVAFLALSLRWRSFAALIFLKPSVFPAALLGIRHRGWWLTIAAMAAVSVVTLPLTVDWLHVVLNARGARSGFLYSLGDVPLLLIPLVARAGSRRQPSAVPGSERLEPLVRRFRHARRGTARQVWETSGYPGRQSQDAAT
jgi:hypothetical protein